MFVSFFKYTSLWFELVNQKAFEMKKLKMAHFTFLFTFHLKVIVCQNFNLPHTCSHWFEKKTICDMIIIKPFMWFTNLFQSYGITMFSRFYKSSKVMMIKPFMCCWLIGEKENITIAFGNKTIRCDYKLSFSSKKGHVKHLKRWLLQNESKMHILWWWVEGFFIKPLVMMQDHISMLIANFMKGFDGVMQNLLMEMVVSHDFFVDVVPPYLQYDIKILKQNQ